MGDDNGEAPEAAEVVSQACQVLQTRAAKGVTVTPSNVVGILGDLCQSHAALDRETALLRQLLKGKL